MKTQTQVQTGATPRNLNECELHLELRRADFIIANAMQFIPAQDIEDFEYSMLDKGLMSGDDFAAFESRKEALNRCAPKPDYLKIMLVFLCLVLGWAWFTVQQDRDLFMDQITYSTQGGQHGSSH